MGFDPRDLPQVGDQYGDGVVAKAVVTAEGIEVTIRESRDAEDLPSGEDRPVSIPQTVYPDALENVTSEDGEERQKADDEERARNDRERRTPEARKESSKNDSSAKAEEKKETGSDKAKHSTEPVKTVNAPVNVVKGGAK